MPKHHSNRKLIPRGSCKQRVKWRCILRGMLLLILFIKEVELYGVDKNHSKKTHIDPWEGTYYSDNLPRYFYSKIVRVDADTTPRPERIRRRKTRVANTHYSSFPLQEETIRPQQIKGILEPVFSAQLDDLSIIRGRDARFKCCVDHLGGYKVGWVKTDTKEIQAIHQHVVTHNPRVSVFNTDHATWYLVIKKVEESDRGVYMCQVNTDPMISQTAFLDILHPPEFDTTETSSSIEVQEGYPLKLKCKAHGRPNPAITWHRENKTLINTRDSEGNKVKVVNYVGEVLDLPKVMRSDMGNYMCIASNAIPPTIIKNIRVTVRFHPMIQVPNQLVGAPLGTDITLVCLTEVFPRSINYWGKDGKGNLIVLNKKFEADIKEVSDFELNMTLKIRNLTKDDFGSYSCACKNTMGEVSSQIRVYEITDERSSNRQNKGRAIANVAKKPGKPVKLLRPAKVGNTISDDDAKKIHYPKEPLSESSGQQIFPNVYNLFLHLSFIFYFIP